jgi:hypothetical protein
VVKIRRLWPLLRCHSRTQAYQAGRTPLCSSGQGDRDGWRLAGRRLAIPIAAALAALCLANLGAHGRFSVSPFGNVFLLARLLGDGPAAEVLHRDCPAAGWRLCPYASAFPMPSDAFLWAADSPLARAGGAKAVSGEADAIAGRAFRSNPGAVAAAAIRNTAIQFTRFASGDGLNPWPREVSPWIGHDFPSAEMHAYLSARQQSGSLAVPFGSLHQAVGIAGVIACLALLPRVRRRSPPHCLLIILVLTALPLNAAITGALSGPHDRYQARLMWLPPFAAILSAAALRRHPA